MHEIEPFYNWRQFYVAEEDEKSPFFGREYSEFEFTIHFYNFLIHPQWDEFGSQTLFMKIIFADYDLKFCVIELLGEWNDALNNDIMILKRDIVEELQLNGIDKFVFIGENVLNFHYSDDSYYEEWFQEIEEGWIALMNFKPHVLAEMKKARIDWYLHWGGPLDELPWRTLSPAQLLKVVDDNIRKRIG